jgi:tyrosine-protein kinase Etk/Wzc
MQIEETIKSTTTTNTGKSELWNLSLRDIFYKYVRFLPLFILSIAFTLFISYLYLRYAIPVYNVSGSMIIRNIQTGSSSQIDELMGGGKTQNIQNEIEVLRSKDLMARVVDSLNLQWTYYAKGKIKTVNIYNQGPFTVEGLKFLIQLNHLR